MELFTILFMTSIALACIYAGYKLFCGLPALNGASRTGVVILNVIPGILLALIGTGLLAAQVNGVVSHHRQRAGDGTSFHPSLHPGTSGFLYRNHAA